MCARYAEPKRRGGQDRGGAVRLHPLDAPVATIAQAQAAEVKNQVLDETAGENPSSDEFAEGFTVAPAVAKATGAPAPSRPDAPGTCSRAPMPTATG